MATDDVWARVDKEEERWIQEVVEWTVDRMLAPIKAMVERLEPCSGGRTDATECTQRERLSRLRAR